MKKKFIPQIGSNNTVKLYDSATGQLLRIINVGGNILSQPICVESELYVTVSGGTGSVIKFFSLPNGNLKKIQPV